MNNDREKEYVETKLITGERLYIAKNSVVGYCHFAQHKRRILFDAYGADFEGERHGMNAYSIKTIRSISGDSL